MRVTNANKKKLRKILDTHSYTNPVFIESDRFRITNLFLFYFNGKSSTYYILISLFDFFLKKRKKMDNLQMLKR